MARSRPRSPEHLQSHVLSIASPEPQSPPGFPPDAGENSHGEPHGEPEHGAQPRKKRHVSLYDVVAGRLTVRNFRCHRRSESPTKHRPRPLSEPQHQGRLSHASRHIRLAPEEVFFRRRGASVRHAQRDWYSAADGLSAAHRRLLPDSPLLKAVHEYAACFYESAARRRGPACFVGSRLVDERSLDDTALIAFGLLLEEAGREALGKTGALVFAESRRHQGLSPEDDGACSQHGSSRKHGKRRRLDPTP